jgi:hypothetical protein
MNLFEIDPIRTVGVSKYSGEKSLLIPANSLKAEEEYNVRLVLPERTMEAYAADFIVRIGEINPFKPRVFSKRSPQLEVRLKVLDLDENVVDGKVSSYYINENILNNRRPMRFTPLFNEAGYFMDKFDETDIAIQGLLSAEPTPKDAAKE